MTNPKQGGLRLLYASYHCCMDPCGSAGVNARDLLTLLSAQGWHCRAYTGPVLSFEGGQTLQSVLNHPVQRMLLGPEGKILPCNGAPVPCSLVNLSHGGVPVTIFEAGGTLGRQAPARIPGYLYLAHLERILQEFQPDVLLTHGDHWLTRETIIAGKRRGIPVVFWVEQLNYQMGEVLRYADARLAPSAYVQFGVREGLKLECRMLPPPIDWKQRVVADSERKFVTFVNPTPDKGVFFFAGLAQELRRRRADIPFLVVEGRGRNTWLSEAGLDMDKMGNVFGMAATQDPRMFYRASRLMVIPSLGDEASGRVAAEATACGIPVLASRRGALHDVLAKAGFLLDIPAKFTPATVETPGPADVAPWVDLIVRLWNDEPFYRREQQRSRAAAEIWKPEMLGAAYADLFATLAKTTGRAARSEAPPIPATWHDHAGWRISDEPDTGTGWRMESMPDVMPSAPSAAPSRSRGGRRLLFSAFHCLLDPSSGAAHSARDLLNLLTEKGWECRIFCGSQLDFEDGRTFELLVGEPAFRSRLNVQAVRAGSEQNLPFTLYDVMQTGIPSTVFDSPGIRPYQAPSDKESAAYVTQFQRVVDEFRPDVMLTYGSYPASVQSMAYAKMRGAAVVFWLRNCAYKGKELFAKLDGVLVPSRFSRDYYREQLGLECTPIPSPLVWARVQCPEIQGKYVTFVNPLPNKGVYVFGRIAEEMFERRPDIPFLVVEGRGNAGWLRRTGLDLDRLKNIFGMAHTPEPRSFYRVSKIVLVPSLWKDTFPRVAAESLLNGIPVLGTRRGGLPEQLEKAGFLFDIPTKYTPDTTEMPTAEEVAPWIDTIIRLWDDRAFYERERQRCRSAAEAWKPERLAKAYDEFFTRLVKKQ